MAKQADGAVLASYADTVVLATAVASQTVKPETDFLPLTVNYQEKEGLKDRIANKSGEKF